MRILMFNIILLFFAADLLALETVHIDSVVTLHYELPSGWVATTEPPQFLIDEMAEHIEHDAMAKGQSPSEKQLEQAAKQRFADNEVLLYNPNSHSFMTLDFSQLRQGERAPSRKTIKLSTRYAAESLKNEEGITDLHTDDSPVEIAGAWHAYRFDANYRQHDKPIEFIGIVGFSSTYWFYFYYTDYLQDKMDRRRAEELLRTIRIDTTKK